MTATTASLARERNNQRRRRVPYRIPPAPRHRGSARRRRNQQRRIRDITHSSVEQGPLTEGAQRRALRRRKHTPPEKRRYEREEIPLFCLARAFACSLRGRV